MTATPVIVGSGRPTHDSTTLPAEQAAAILRINQQLTSRSVAPTLPKTSSAVDIAISTLEMADVSTRAFLNINIGVRDPTAWPCIESTKRIYEPLSLSDGRRVLVDRLWPRGSQQGAGAPRYVVEGRGPNPLSVGAFRAARALVDRRRGGSFHGPARKPSCRKPYRHRNDSQGDLLRRPGRG